MVNNPAGFWIRFGANLLDGLLFSAIGWLGFLFFAPNSNYSDAISTSMQQVYLLLVPILWYGYTIGKKMCHIRILRMDGKNVTFWTMVKRNIIAGLVYSLPLLVPFVLLFSMVGSEALHLFTFSNEQFEETLLVITESSSTLWTALLMGSFLTLSLIAASAIMVGVTKSRRSIHDFIAGTYVTYDTPEESKKVYSEENDLDEFLS